MHSSSSQGHLERRLKNRHIQLIALGGTIGTGLFLGSAGIIELAGPSVLLGYAIGGLIIPSMELSFSCSPRPDAPNCRSNDSTSVEISNIRPRIRSTFSVAAL